MKIPEGEPIDWTKEQRREFITEVLSGYKIIVNWDPETCAESCQGLRQNLMDKGYTWQLESRLGAIGKFRCIFAAPLPSRNIFSSINDSERQAVVVSACLTLLAELKEKKGE